ncbi:MAG: hypothetical protein KF901_34255, partial [Myxococcales bacterium]|nr:hypothetical protein [Myxococcales bacterium]
PKTEVGRALRAVGLEVTASLYRFVVWGRPSRAAFRLRFNSRDGVNAYVDTRSTSAEDRASKLTARGAVRAVGKGGCS